MSWPRNLENTRELQDSTILPPSLPKPADSTESYIPSNQLPHAVLQQSGPPRGSLDGETALHKSRSESLAWQSTLESLQREQESPTPSFLGRERSDLWKEAYETLRESDQSLVEHYERLLQDQFDMSSAGIVAAQLAHVADAQLKRVTARQWTFKRSATEYTVRDKVEGILGMLNKSANFISVAMTHTPSYVSVPWSAITALIPMIMNDLKEHKSCISGLETMAKITLAYQLAENTFLAHEDTKSMYKKSVFDLYVAILKYQALAIKYFSKSTIRRFAKNALGSAEWANMPASLSSLDDNARRSLSFLGVQYQIDRLSKAEALFKSHLRRFDHEIKKPEKKRQEVAKVKRWISAVPVSLDHRDVLQNLGEDHVNSGSWYLQQCTSAWMDRHDGNKCHYLRGGIGTGKSSLLSILIENQSCSSQERLAFFYCSKKSDKGNERASSRDDCANVLRSVLSQLAVYSNGRAIHDELLKRYNFDHNGDLSGLALSGQECILLLEDIFLTHELVYFTIIIDALDECSDHDKLLESLHTAVSGKPNVKLALSSRFNVNVEDYFPNAHTITIESQNAGDIERYLECELDKRQAGSGITEGQIERLRKVLTERANGMFVWVKLQLNLVLHETKSKRARLQEDIESRLVTLEASEAIGEDQLLAAYDEVYNIAVGGHGQDRRKELVITALRWVLCALRPLTLPELAFATCVQPDGAIAEGLHERDVLDFCSNLLVQDSEGIIRLSHLSARQYLEKRIPPDFEAALAHLQAALACLFFANSPRYHEIEYVLSLCLILMGDPLSPSSKTPELERQISNFSSNIPAIPIIQHQSPITISFSDSCSSSSPSECTDGEESDEAEVRLGSARIAAIIRPKRDGSSTRRRTVEVLKDVVKKITAHMRRRPLPEQSLDSPVAMHRGSSPELAVLYQISLLSCETVSAVTVSQIQNCGAGGYRLLSLYIANGGDIEQKDPMGSTLLSWAAACGHADMVELLLEARASPDMPDQSGNTALHHAVRSRFRHCVSMLLRSGADKNARNIMGQTPLHLAYADPSPSSDIIALLRASGADFDARDDPGRLPELPGRSSTSSSTSMTD